TGIGNPESFRGPTLWRSRTTPTPSLPVLPESHDNSATDGSQQKQCVNEIERRYRAVFCSFKLPKYPGHSGGEIRDFHLLKHLLSHSRMDFFHIYDNCDDGREDPLIPLLDNLIGPECVDGNGTSLANGSLPARVAARLGRGRALLRGGAEYHREVYERISA